MIFRVGLDTFCAWCGQGWKMGKKHTLDFRLSFQCYWRSVQRDRALYILLLKHPGFSKLNFSIQMKNGWHLPCIWKLLVYCSHSPEGQHVWPTFVTLFWAPFLTVALIWKKLASQTKVVSHYLSPPFLVW